MNIEPKITQDVKSAVNAYLLARAYAETIRDKVDSIQRKILESAKYYIDPKHLERHRRRKTDERITDPDETWLLSDSEHHDYLIGLKHELIKAGFEIKSIPGKPEYSYFCPALVVEDLQRKTEKIMIDAAAKMLGNEVEAEDFHHGLLCAGLDKYHEFIDLVCKLVVNLPGFQNPLTGKTI